jgi:hypothetical protein
MGLISRLMLGKPIEGGIRAEATVESRSNIPVKRPAYIGGAKLGLLVAQPGGGDRTVALSCTAPRKRYPVVGQTIPIRIDPADPSRVQVIWDELPEIEGQ